MSEDGTNARGKNGRSGVEQLSLLEIFKQAIEKDPVPVLGIIFGCLSGVAIVMTTVITAAWRSVRVRDAELDLKQQMLEKGMSADEIERVVKASAYQSRRKR
ncbi:hypothetical protein K2Y11_21460 [bacterium]|nr:hypothetical protein [bacterium]